MSGPTTTRSCDALGVCQQRATPCTSRPTTERRTRERTHGPACTADLCQQGRTACPCPQACELPGADADPLREEPSTAFELVGMWLVIAVLASGLLFAIKTCASA